MASANTGPAGLAGALAPSPGQVALRWLSQGGWAFRSPAGVVWCVDPYLSNYGPPGAGGAAGPAAGTRRAGAGPCRALPHNHSDHVDPLTLPEIAQASPGTRFYAPGGRPGDGWDGHRPRAHPDGWGGRPRRSGARATAAESDVTADVVYASHSGDAVGYVFRVGAVGGKAETGHRALRVYVTGDTLYDAQLVSDVTRRGRARVCINGRLGNMRLMRPLDWQAN